MERIAHGFQSRLFHFIVAVSLCMTVLGSLQPVSAQSPVAEQPPIKVVRVFERLCLPSVDPSAGTVQEARTACPDVAGGMVFTLTSRDSSYPRIPLTVSTSGETEWREVPAGAPFTIAHSGSFDYGMAWVSCRFYGNFDPAVPDTERVYRPAPPSHAIEIGFGEPGLTNYQAIECYWFDLPVTAELPASGPTPTPAQPGGVADTTNAGVLAEEEQDPTVTPNPNAEVAGTTDAGVQAEPETEPDASPVTSANTLLDGTGARLDLRVWGCPFHFDAMATPVEQLMSFCQRDMTDIPFTFNGSAPATGTLSGNTVPYGSVTIRQETYNTYATLRTFCYTQPATASHGPLNASMESPFTAESGDRASVTLTVDSGDAIDCIWFVGVVTTQDLGSLLVTAYQCPEGYDTHSGGLNDLLSTCHIPQSTAYFELQQPASISGNSVDANGYMGFVNYSAATYQLVETQPIGWATERVFCRSTQADDWNHPTDPYVEYPVGNKSAITVDLIAHWELDCVWFDTKGVDHAYLDLNAWSCPLNFTPTASTPRDTFAQTCSVGVSEAEFEVESGLSFALSATSTDGYALFQEPVPYGSLDIRGSGPNTHQFLRAFCGDAPFIGIGAIPSTWTSFTQPQLTFPAQVNYQVVCEFYVVPLSTAVEPAASPEASSAEASSADDEAAQDGDSPATVDEQDPAPEPVATPDEDVTTAESTPTPTPAIVASQDGSTGSNESSAQAETGDSATLLLNVHICPVGYDIYAQGADPASDCVSATGAPAVTVNGGASETSADGVAGWTALAPGGARIETGTGGFLGTCSSDLRAISSDSIVTPYVFADPNGAIGISLLAGETLTCDWYDVAEGEMGTVSAILFTCPGTTVIETQCESAAGPASVHFEPVGGVGTAFDLAIDASGTGQASATGSYQLGGFPEGSCSIESDGFDASGALVIEPGAAVEVRIYLCGD